MTDKEFLINMARASELYMGHDLETCGQCAHLMLDAQVAIDMLTVGDTEKGAMQRWADTVERRWKETKFYKLWQQFEAEGKDPATEMRKLGIEP